MQVLSEKVKLAATASPTRKRMALPPDKVDAAASCHGTANSNDTRYSKYDVVFWEANW